ncbi:MAG: hypothetical protein OEY51_04990, partial [Cyclobacteriaceae bacterium]|nr:hypothetical protein [Cyclobacteriaceae bacterium]
MNFYNKPYIFLLFLLGMSHYSRGQLHLSPLVRNYKNIASGARTEATPLSLPFWDDFSTSRIFPNPEKWINSEDVFVGDGMSVNPPSIFTATFDGTDAAGKPYSLDTSSDGPTDRLTSQPIDLSLYGPSDKIYMSFFYQAKGEGEIPNKNDSLRLEFKQKNGLWKTAWSITG